jgi:hypothetical protein
MLPIATSLVREQMEVALGRSAAHGAHRADVAGARSELDAELGRVRSRLRDLEAALALIEGATEDGMRAARDDGERAETLRASALHARRLARA